MGLIALTGGPIAIFGATSVLARDFLDATSIPKSSFVGFSRDLAAARDLPIEVRRYEAFSYMDKYSAIINFIGFGSPTRAARESSTIIEVTREFDHLALGYLTTNESTSYIYLSSGSVYNFLDRYADQGPFLNDERFIDESFKYSFAKYEAETRHREISARNIVDIRVFNYVSARQGLEDGFLFTDLAKALVLGEAFSTGPDDLVRDFASKNNLADMLDVVLERPQNISFDLFTAQSISKWELVDALVAEFDLKVSLRSSADIKAPTGLKDKYVPQRFNASNVGYQPKTSSLENVLQVLRSLGIKKQSS